jgi:hypothetical protein
MTIRPRKYYVFRVNRRSNGITREAIPGTSGRTLLTLAEAGAVALQAHAAGIEVVLALALHPR